MKPILLVFVGVLFLLACILVFRNEHQAPIAEQAGSIARDPTVSEPSFAVRIEKPRQARPLFGLLPSDLEAKLAGHGDLTFGSSSPGARISAVGDHRIELRAEGWFLSIETDPEGAITGDTQLLFSLMLANRQRTLRCHPAEPARGYLRATTTSAATRAQDFRVELARCENTETGRTIEWPPAPLTVVGTVWNAPATDLNFNP